MWNCIIVFFFQFCDVTTLTTFHMRIWLVLAYPRSWQSCISIHVELQPIHIYNYPINQEKHHFFKHTIVFIDMIITFKTTNNFNFTYKIYNNLLPFVFLAIMYGCHIAPCNYLTWKKILYLKIFFFKNKIKD